MTYEFIKVETAARVTTITLNRPEVMNAINPPMHHELQAAFDTFAADTEQFLCVVTGAGPRAFCSGSDLKAAAAGERGAYPSNGYGGLIERFDLNKLVIAAVNGVSLGGGFELALACDIIIAAENASFGLPEPRVGAVALGGGLHRLARQIGLKRAMGLIMTGAFVSAQDGYVLGFVNEVVTPENLKPTVDRWCEQVLANAPLAIRASKEAVMRGLDEESLQSAMKHQADYPEFKAWSEAEDTMEGFRAFAEKRVPVWKGR
jgi:enoyl-CoA hydratase/carnithine racemase